MKHIAKTILCLLLTTSVCAQDKALLNPNTIPDTLKKECNAVYRNEEITCNIISDNKAIIKYAYVITILNERGLDDAQIRIPYSKSLSKVSIPRGAIFDKNGKRLRSVKSSDIVDISAISGYSLYDDSRFIYYEPPVKTTPFTIVYTYEEELNGTLFLPTWTAFKGYNTSVENSVFKVTVPNNLKFKYHEQAIKNPVKKTEINNSITYTWTAKGITPPKSEPYSESALKQFPSVFIALDEFEFYKVNGSQKNWKDLGQWIDMLNDGKSEVPEKTKSEILELTSGMNSKREKIDAIYRYMQNKTHYVNLAVGIGGWQPIEASRVDEVNYGDCKALSNYTKSLLNIANIESHYTIIKAGSRIPDFRKEFVTSQFNHVILCVPNDGDTVWLECTNQKIPPGFLSTFTDNRFALLINGENSKLVKTPELTGFLNGEKRKASVHINDNLHAEFMVSALYSGEYQNEVYWWSYDNKEDIKRVATSNLTFSDVTLKSFDYKPLGLENAIEEKLNFSVPSLATRMGSRIILDINPLNKETYIPKKVFNRRSDIEIQRSMMESDTIEFILPDGYIMETRINPVEIVSPFGSYKAKVDQIGNKLIYIRSAYIKKGRYDKSLYAGFVDFFKEIKVADEQKVLLAKQ